LSPVLFFPKLSGSDELYNNPGLNWFTHLLTIPTRSETAEDSIFLFLLCQPGCYFYKPGMQSYDYQLFVNKKPKKKAVKVLISC
jgi:hypothetical protein